MKPAIFHPKALEILRLFPDNVRRKCGILVFHAFAKKTQKTPQREIEQGQKRLQEIDDEKG